MPRSARELELLRAAAELAQRALHVVDGRRAAEADAHGLGVAVAHAHAVAVDRHRELGRTEAALVGPAEELLRLCDDLLLLATDERHDVVERVERWHAGVARA